MNYRELKNNPGIISSVRSTRDYWDLISDPDAIFHILSNPLLSNKLEPSVLEELILMRDAIHNHPELKPLIREYQAKGNVFAAFTVSEMIHMILILTAYPENPDTFTPAGWVALLSGMTVSMIGALSAILSRRKDYAYYEQILRNYLLSKEP